MGTVGIVRTNQGIRKSVEEAISLVGGLERFVGGNDTVMLKPNLNDTEAYTDKEIVESLILLLRHLNVRKVFIGESTFGDSHTTNLHFRKTGYVELARRYGVDLVNLNESEAVDVQVPNPLVLDKIRIARPVFEADKIINIANMKVHYATGVSLALKNLKGVLVGDEKRRFHQIGLEKAIVDLNNTIKPCLNMIDGISCMERMGPRGGDMVNLNLIVAGESAAEVDYVGCRIMGYDVSEVKHLQYYVEMNGVDLNTVRVVGETIEEVRYPFKKVEMESLIPREVRVHNRNACSACMNALLLSCRLLGGDLTRSVDVYLGALIEDEDTLGGVKLAFGNCCPAEMVCEKRIRGCPPYPFDLGACLREYLRQGISQK
jgi:uncharacterized protein (DUF362 family)